MIMTPEWIGEDVYHPAQEDVVRKRNPPGLKKIRLEEYSEGLSVQILHIGSYEDEGQVLARMQDRFI